MKRVLSSLLVTVLILGLFGGVTVNAEDVTESTAGAIIEYFKNPDAKSKPMARMWFPDASAAVDENDVVEKHILELADKGFGGVEYADAGLPIVICNSDITKVYGSNVSDDADVAAAFAELKSKSNVRTVATRADALGALKELNVTPYADYNQSQLETTLYTDAADGTNYYYMYNNARPTNSGMLSQGQGASYKGEAGAVSNVKVTLAGNGVPYKLDAITGEVVQVGEYTVNGNGTVTFVIDKLYGGDSVIYAVTENTVDFPQADVYVKSVDQSSANYSIVRTDDGLALRSNTPATYAVAMSDNSDIDVNITKSLDAIDLNAEKWDLVIHSYGPEYKNAHLMIGENRIMTVDPSDTVITTVDFGKQDLGNWRSIVATSEQLTAIGVADMKNVSGVGEYTLTFNSPANWDANTGAYLDVAYGEDQIGSVTVNGTTLLANNATDKFDLAGLLRVGQNTIKIKLSTSLYPRAFVEHYMHSTTMTTVNNGLTSVKLTPYQTVKLEKPIPVTSIKINSIATTTVRKGKTLQLTATLTPADANFGTEITWSTSNAAAVTVNEKTGLIPKAADMFWDFRFAFLTFLFIKCRRRQFVSGDTKFLILCLTIIVSAEK